MSQSDFCAQLGYIYLLLMSMLSLQVGLLSDWIFVQVRVVLSLILSLGIIFKLYWLIHGGDHESVRYFQSDERFLALSKLPRPPLPQEDGIVNLMDLNCICMTMHKFISCTRTCMVQVRLLLLLLLFSASSSEVFMVWFDPFSLSDKADWWLAPNCLFFIRVCTTTLTVEYLLGRIELLPQLF